MILKSYISHVAGNKSWRLSGTGLELPWYGFPEWFGRAPDLALVATKIVTYWIELGTNEIFVQNKQFFIVASAIRTAYDQQHCGSMSFPYTTSNSICGSYIIPKNCLLLSSEISNKYLSLPRQSNGNIKGQANSFLFQQTAAY